MLSSSLNIKTKVRDVYLNLIIISWDNKNSLTKKTERILFSLK